MVGALATLLDESDVSLRGTRREANTVPRLENTPCHFFLSSGQCHHEELSGCAGIMLTNDQLPFPFSGCTTFNPSPSSNGSKSRSL